MIRDDRLCVRNLWHLGALGDPCCQQGNLFVAEPRTLRRHLTEVLIRAGDDAQQTAFGRLTRDQDATAVSSLPDTRWGVEPQTRFLLLGSVALEAVLGKQGLNVSLEVDSGIVFRSC